MIRLCLSSKSLLNIDSAAVTLNTVFINFYVSKDYEFANLTPWSVRNLSVAPSTCIQF